MKESQRVPSLDNTCFHLLENGSSSPRENSMQCRVMKLCRGGQWSAYLAVPQRQGRRSKGISNGYRGMKRLSCSSIMTTLAVRRRRSAVKYYHRARSRSLTYSETIKMRQTPSLPMTLTRFVKLFGTRDLTVQMESSMAKPS